MSEAEENKTTAEIKLTNFQHLDVPENLGLGFKRHQNFGNEYDGSANKLNEKWLLKSTILALQEICDDNDLVFGIEI